MVPPILVTGCARSGTSLVAAMIDICGGYGGNMFGPNNNNQKGMFENRQIREKILKSYLSSIGKDRLGQYPLPDTSNIPIPRDWNRKIELIMESQGLLPEQPWYYKDAKIALTWPIWQYAFPDAKWIIVRRKPTDIVNSCRRTGFMRAFSREQFRKEVGVKTEEEGWFWWIREYEKRFVEIIEAGVNTKVIWPERMVVGDYKQMMETIDWLGLEWNSDALSFVDPKLWKARRK